MDRSSSAPSLGSREGFISVDIEASGSVPGLFSMLSVGACLAANPESTFYAELQPLPEAEVTAEALSVANLDIERLRQEGASPVEAMNEFAVWIQRASGDNAPVFVAFNAPFDWAFVNYYFQRFYGSNPFGFAALDVKALYMGFSGCNWDETRSSQMPEEFRPRLGGEHNALSDAQAQAHSFRRIMGSAHSRSV